MKWKEVKVDNEWVWIFNSQPEIEIRTFRQSDEDGNRSIKRYRALFDGGDDTLNATTLEEAFKEAIICAKECIQKDKKIILKREEQFKNY